MQDEQLFRHSQKTDDVNASKTYLQYMARENVMYFILVFTLIIH